MKLKFFLPFLAVMAISSAFISCSEDDDNKGNAVVYSTDALMLENFTLDGMEPTITRASVEEDFPEIKFLVFFKNNTELRASLKYDVGMALYDENNHQVKTYPLYENFNLRYNHDYKMDEMVIISKDISDGTYQLKPICKISGEEEWQEFKFSNELALTLTVSGNQIEVKEAFNENKGIIQVKSIRLDKTIVPTDEAFKVTLNIFSNKKASIPIYIAQESAGGKYQKLDGAVFTPNGSGEGNVTLSYIPSTPGKQTYYILSSLNEKPITQFDVIAKGQIYDFTIDNITDEIENTLADNSIEGTFIVKNFDDKTFSLDMYVMLGTIDMNDISLRFDSLFENSKEHQLIPLSTPSLEEEKVKFTFNNLNYDSYYVIAYGIKDENGKFRDMSGDRPMFLYTTPSDPSAEGKKRTHIYK